MDKLKVALLALVALLLVVQIIDRSREPAQLGALKQSVDQLNETLRRGVVAQVPAGGATQQPVAQAPVKDPARDGNPKLGVNFLIPYDRSYFRADQVKGTLRLFEESPKGLNWMIENSATAADVHGLVNDSLCDRPALHPEQWSEVLATAVVISDDYKTYTFTIRPGITWQVPTLAKDMPWLAKPVPLTAGDFAFTLQMIRDPQVECPQLKVYYEDIDRWETPDDQTLIVRWKRKVYTSLSATMGLMPTPRHVYGSDRDGTPYPGEQLGAQFNKHWFDQARQAIGVGNYVLEAWEPDKTISFRRNPDYWGAGQHFERIEWDGEVKQPDPQLVAFKNGQAHSHGLRPGQYKSEILDHNERQFAALDPKDPKAGRAGSLGWERVKSIGFSYIGWNMRTQLFADKRVRQAMSHALPKQRVIDEVFFGLGEPILSDVHPSSQYANKELKAYDFDLARARALLEEAGWRDSDGDGVVDKEIAGERLPLSFKLKYYANSAEWDRTLAIFREQLRTIGVDLQAQSFEWKELLRIYEERDFDAVVGAWRTDFDIDYFQLWHSSEADKPESSNHCGFKNPRVDQLADDLRTTFDTAKRVAIAKEIQAIIHEEQPYTFFKASEGIFVWQNHGAPSPRPRWLDGVTEALDKLHPLRSRSSQYWRFKE
ncbi:MAG: hypothetical protein H0W72_05495 [Planctomycetes bacterium]|nr:hypothetical protein [Planctomycetota bacterium]